MFDHDGTQLEDAGFAFWANSKVGVRTLEARHAAAEAALLSARSAHVPKKPDIRKREETCGDAADRLNEYKSRLSVDLGAAPATRPVFQLRTHASLMRDDEKLAELRAQEVKSKVAALPEQFAYDTNGAVRPNPLRHFENVNLYAAVAGGDILHGMDVGLGF